MGEPMVFRDTGLAVAHQLEELLLIRNDLKGALACLTFWSSIPEDSNKDEESNPANEKIAASLFRDAITQFVACFDSKNAVPLVVEEVYPNSKGIAPYFKWLRALRNSYTAHRHGSARQCIVGALVDNDTNQYIGFGHMFMVFERPGREGDAQLLAAVSHAIKYTETRIESLRNQFDNEAKAIAPDILKSLPAKEFNIQNPETIGKSRGEINSRKKGDAS